MNLLGDSQHDYDDDDEDSGFIEWLRDWVRDNIWAVLLFVIPIVFIVSISIYNFVTEDPPFTGLKVAQNQATQISLDWGPVFTITLSGYNSATKTINVNLVAGDDTYNYPVQISNRSSRGNQGEIAPIVVPPDLAVGWIEFEPGTENSETPSFIFVRAPKGYLGTIPVATPASAP